MDTATARAEIEAQPVLHPGDEGWWKVYGASTRSIRPGDYVLAKEEEFYVQDTYPREDFVRVGIVIDGVKSSIGILHPIILLRRGTRATLA
jgi:hypothetical protein